MRAVVSEAFEAIAKVEELMSEWKPNSEISRVNRNAGLKATQVSEATMKVLSAALDIASKSNGAFDQPGRFSETFGALIKNRLDDQKEQMLNGQKPLWTTVSYTSPSMLVPFVSLEKDGHRPGRYCQRLCD